MVLAIIVLVAILLAAMPVEAKGIALFIAGLVATGLTQLFKGNLSGRMALTLNVVLSAVIAVVASYAAGDIQNWQELVKNATVIFGLAQLVYQYLTTKKKEPAPEPARPKKSKR